MACSSSDADASLLGIASQWARQIPFNIGSVGGCVRGVVEYIPCLMAGRTAVGGCANNDYRVLGIVGADMSLVLHIGCILLIKESAQAICQTVTYWKRLGVKDSANNGVALDSSLLLQESSTQFITGGGDQRADGIEAEEALHRVTKYWRLVIEAVRDGHQKSPSPTIALSSIANRKSPSVVGDRFSARDDTLLVLPLSSKCFTFSNVCSNGVNGNISNSCISDTSSQPTYDDTLGTASEPWSTLYVLWSDTVRYRVDPEGIRKLLSSYPASVFTSSVNPSSPTKVEMATVNLALLWYLANVRRVYDALIVQKDTQRCENELDELQEYMQVVFERCVAPWPNDVLSRQGKTACSPRQCWEVLDQAAAHLRWHCRRMSLDNVSCLFRYMYGTTHFKIFSAVGIGLLTGVSSRVIGAGAQARDAINRALTCYFQQTVWWDIQHDGSAEVIAGQRVAAEVTALCGFELMRLAINVVLTHLSSRFINASASQRRDAVKAKLYEALTHMPLSFFDLYSYNEVEEIVYYVNDLEGVDVHLHQYVYTAVTGFLAARAALSPLSSRACALVLGSVGASYLIHWIASGVASTYNRMRASGRFAFLQREDYATAMMDEEDDAQVYENVSSSQRADGIMLRGLEIISALPQLRPYGADVSLMSWWNRHTDRKSYRPAKGAGLMYLMLMDSYGEILPAIGQSIVKLLDWLLPVVVSVYGAACAASTTMSSDDGFAMASSRIMDATAAVRAGVEVGLDAQRIVEVFVHNAYKASMIACILDHRNWESSTSGAAGEQYRRRCSIAGGDGGESDNAWPVKFYRRINKNLSFTAAPGGEDGSCGAEAITRSFDKLMVSRICTHNLQFAYPSNPTVPVFAAPLSVDIVLQDPETRKGRLICLVGPSGRGKSTLLHLLLGLYPTPRQQMESVGGEAPISLHFSALPNRDVAAANHAQRSNSSFVSTNSLSGSTLDAYAHVAELSAIPCSVLRNRLFGYVPQVPTIFSGATIAHNITLRAHISIEETAALARATRCAAMAQCDFIQRFPQGMLTAIGDSSGWSNAASPAGQGDPCAGGLVRLSGGQAQRLMLARALYHGGGVLLMDEPTASLDPETRQEIVKVWRQLLDDGIVKGILCATHDQEIVKIADEVVSLAP